MAAILLLERADAGLCRIAALCQNAAPMRPRIARTLAFVVALAVIALAAVAHLAGEATSRLPVGAVYTMTNDPGGNAIVAYDRYDDGRIVLSQTVPTGGLGTGGGLGSQGSVTLSDDGGWLFAVNAGSDDVSVFRVRSDGLTLVGRHASGGDRPISVTQADDVVYVLNAGVPNNIAGFTHGPRKALSLIPGSERPLSGANVNPAQVSFSPSGDILVVTEKATNALTSYTVDVTGRPSEPRVTASSGHTPFGFVWGKRDRLLVSEAFGGTTNGSALSSYDTDFRGAVTGVSASVPTHQTAACWTAVTRSGRFAYTTNAGSSSVSGFAVARDGSVSPLDADGLTAHTGEDTSPNDAVVSTDDRFLYVLTGHTPSIRVFRIRADGALSGIGSVALPATHVGLAVR
jgi:6-phosphogluconolactonase